MSGSVIRRYVAIGDSLSEGISDWGRPDRAIGFAYILADLLRATSPELAFTNLGVGGARAADVLHHQVSRAVELAPDLLTLVVGANDVPGTPSAQFRRDYRALMERLRAGIPGMIVVANLPDFAHLLPVQYGSYRAALTSRVHEFNQVIAESATVQRVLLVDLHSTREAEDPRNLSNDGVHPNARGYRAMARAFVETLNRAGLALTVPALD